MLGSTVKRRKSFYKYSQTATTNRYPLNLEKCVKIDLTAEVKFGTTRSGICAQRLVQNAGPLSVRVNFIRQFVARLTLNSQDRVALISPTYDVSPCSTWRNKVNATWRFLDENYIISKSEVGATNLHVSYLPNLDDGGRMRTAWCALYFEAAIGSLAPGPAGRESFVKLNSQSCYLSTIPSDKILQTIKTRVENGGSIGRIMNDKDGASESKMYRWNFRLNGSLEFRLPHGCVSAVEVLGWAEFVLIFVRAAYTIKKPEDLDVYSARRMDELMLFLRDRGGLVSDVTDSTRLKQFFRDKGYDYTRPPHLQ